jgi:hypothetical protein
MVFGFDRENGIQSPKLNFRLRKKSGVEIARVDEQREERKLRCEGRAKPD